MSKYTKAERSWIMYDVANSAPMLLATSVIPIYFNSLADGPALVAWSYAETIAALLIALLMPILGSIADMKGMKHKFILGTVGTGVIATIGMAIPTTAIAFLVVYIISSVMLNASIVFYDALLVDATTDDHMDEVSSLGYAWGYIGSVVPFLICIALILGGPKLGFIDSATATKISFAITAIWWLIFTIPLVRDVKQTHYKPRMEHPIREAFSGIKTTLRDIFSNQAIRTFMIAYFFYIDGVHTIIKLSTSYGTDLGIAGSQLILALLFTQFVAFPSAIIYGKLGKKFGTRTMILVGILGYTFITIFAAFFLRSAAEFWFLGAMVGIFQGGLQALSRSEFGKLCPKEHANEYFGFFDIFGKYAAILGTFIVGTMTAITGQSHLGVFSVVVLFIIGFVVMLRVPKSSKA